MTTWWRDGQRGEGWPDESQRPSAILAALTQPHGETCGCGATLEPDALCGVRLLVCPACRPTIVVGMRVSGASS